MSPTSPATPSSPVSPPPAIVPDLLDEAVTAVRRNRSRIRRRHALVIAGTGLMVVLAFAARVFWGDYLITVPDFWRIVTGTDVPGASFILMESKLPRACAGLLAGAAFGLAGAIFQASLRNPLASPDIIGISAGASAGAVVAILQFGISGFGVSLAAVAGALVVSVAIVLAAGAGTGHKLVVVGVAMTAALQSLIQYLFARASVFDAQLALVWLTGSLNNVNWTGIRLFAVLFALLCCLIAWLAPRLRVIEFGPDVAAGLGVAPRTLAPLLLVGVVLVASATALTGPIAFVALLAGPIARQLNAGRTTLLGAALVGSFVVVAGDYLAAYALPDTNLPVGVVTGAIGAPILVWLLLRRERTS